MGPVDYISRAYVQELKRRVAGSQSYATAVDMIVSVHLTRQTDVCLLAASCNHCQRCSCQLAEGRGVGQKVTMGAEQGVGQRGCIGSLCLDERHG